MSIKDVRDHYLRTFGPPSRIAEYPGDSCTLLVYKWNARASREGVNIYATLGASNSPLDGYPATHRIEFHVGLLPELDEVAAPLATLALHVAEAGVAVDHGHSFGIGQPLWEGTEMTRLLVLRSSGDEVIQGIVTSEGSHVTFLQVVPVYESEVAYRTEHGIDGLVRLWRESRVAFWDPARPEPVQTVP